MDVLAEQYDEQYNHGDTPAEGCGDGGAFHAQFRKAEAAEDEGVVADDIEDIDYDGDHHRVDGLVGTGAREAERVRDSAWKKAKAPTIRI